jgi:hypothetical protein
VLTDNGTQFNEKFFLAVCRELGIEKLFTTAYHPQTNGQVERYNRTTVNALRGFVSERQNTWEEYASDITFGYNCRIHSSLGLAPFELDLSRPPPSFCVEHPKSGTKESHETVRICFLMRLKELEAPEQLTLNNSQERCSEVCRGIDLSTNSVRRIRV